MERIIKILLLEDNQYDAELIHHQITKIAIKYQFKHVSEYDDFSKAIDEYIPDIILSDYNLVGFTGMDALELAKQKCPLTPFIIVTGSIDEETAAETIKKGASDYVVKERLIRLDTAIINALILKEEKEEREIANSRLKEQEEKLRSITQSANDAIITISNKGIIDGWNKAAEKIFGFSTSEMLNKNLMAIIPEKYKKGHLQGIERLYKGGAEKLMGKTIELLAVRKNGTEFPIVLSLSTWTVKGQKYYTGMIRDITERKRTEQIKKILYDISNATNITDNLIELTTKIREYLGAIIDTTNFYIALYDEKTDMFSSAYMVDTQEELKDFPAGKSMTNYVIKTQKSWLVNKEKVKELIKTGDVELVGTISEVWLGVPLKIAGKSVGVIAVQSYTDKNAFSESDKEILEFVSEQISVSIRRKRNEDQLKKALKKATEADRLKSAFLANMSHEIRTPMNGILGFSSLLREQDLSGDKQQTYITMIEQSGQRMLNIINDIINISKIESGLIEFHLKDVYVNELMEYIYSFFKPEAEAKGLQISYNSALPLKDSIVNSDREKLLAILTNLVKNAIKFCDIGSIEFGYTEKDQFIEFYVKDTGIGINKSRQHAIFERFIQADIVDKDARQGAGLGLAISKAYIKGLGGKIWVESKKGKGSIFFFTIPGKSGSQKTEEIIPEKSERALNSQSKSGKLELKILVVEDDEASDMILSIMLEESSREILHAKSGTEAIDLCDRNPDIELILMDIKMPGMDGYETASRIRQFNKNVIIIGQSAYAFLGDKEKAIDAGLNDYITKPIEQAKLDSMLQMYFDNN